MGAVSDARSRRIPNWLTFSGLAAALITRLLLGSWAGLKSGIIGMMIASGVFFVIFLMRGMGGGDVKLMAAVGAWVGSGQAFPILFTAAVAGAGLAIFYLVFEKRRQRSARDSSSFASDRTQLQGTARVPFGIAIAASTLLCVGSSLMRR